MKKTPSMLVSKVKPLVVEVKATYDWKKQRAEFEGCKFGTNSYTKSTTSSMSGNGLPWQDDSNSDSVSD